MPRPPGTYSSIRLTKDAEAAAPTAIHSPTLVAFRTMTVAAVAWTPHCPAVDADTETMFMQRLIDRTLLKRVGHPSDLTGPLVFLVSDASSYMTGHNLVVDGGWTVV